MIPEDLGGHTDLRIAIRLAGVRLATVRAENAAVEPACEELIREIEETCANLRAKLNLETLAHAEAIVAVRKMFRGWGLDPSKYRPSSEALLRRVVAGKGIYSISNVVDLTNLGSIETGWPFGVYDAAAIAGEVCFRPGVTGESYEGIGRRVWDLTGRPALADGKGPFGSPISDSRRTQITEDTKDVLTVLYAPASASIESLTAAAEKQALRLQKYAGARNSEAEVVA